MRAIACIFWCVGLATDSPATPSQVAVLVFSSFQEALYLDSDNVALEDLSGAR